MSNCIKSLIYNTQNIIELSKIRLKKSIKKIEMVDLNKLTEKIFGIFNEEIKMKQIQIKKKICLQIENNKIFIDKDKLNLVLFNVISNAFKYTQNGCISLSSKIKSYIEIQ